MLLDNSKDFESIWTKINSEQIEIDKYLENNISLKTLYSIKRTWLRQISNRYLLHQLNESKLTEVTLDEISFETFNCLDIKLDIINKSKAIEFLLKYIYHPDYDQSGGLKVGFSNKKEKILFKENLEKAILIIKNTDRDAYLTIKNYLFSICPVFTKTPLIKGDVISFTLDYSNGLIFYSPCPAILTAETLIHETRHNMLNLILKEFSIVKNADFKVMTPLRDDPRPILGLVHQSFVLYGLTSFYRNLILQDAYREMKNVIKRYNIHMNDYKNSISILNNNRFNLTNRGLQLLDIMLSDLEDHG